MSEDSGLLVAWILLPLFAAVGLYLVWYTRRRRRMLLAFAASHGLIARPETTDTLQKTLDQLMASSEIVRSFDQISSPIHGNSVWLFRAVELLDLAPRSQSQSTHFARIAALFDAPAANDEFFLIDRSGQVRPMRPGAGAPDPRVAEIAKRAGASCDARHPLSVTLAHGHGLIYFEPLVTGGESLSDLDALYRIAGKIRDELTEVA
jgi:hypothetical protein